MYENDSTAADCPTPSCRSGFCSLVWESNPVCSYRCACTEHLSMVHGKSVQLLYNTRVYFSFAQPCKYLVIFWPVVSKSFFQTSRQGRTCKLEALFSCYLQEWTGRLEPMGRCAVKSGLTRSTIRTCVFPPHLGLCKRRKTGRRMREWKRKRQIKEGERMKKKKHKSRNRKKKT